MPWSPSARGARRLNSTRPRTLRQRTLPEDHESLPVPSDRRRHLAGGLVDQHGTSPFGVGAAQRHAAVRAIVVADGRLATLLRLEVVHLHGLDVDPEERRKVHALRMAALALAIRLTLGHHHGGA